ncbi:MAG: DUF2589 domain-containing protein [Bacteroidales bacterium]|nr:DUF2589 domain-containing protein [Bacteroidales bacterium]
MNGKRYGISDALSELLEAAVTADTKASQKSYEMIKKYAYGLSSTQEETPSSGKAISDGRRNYLNQTMDTIDKKSSMVMSSNNMDDSKMMGEEDFYEDETTHELAMTKFTMKDASGNMQEVSIPQITMMPLPLLHVTEATFDLDLSINLVDKTSYVGALTDEEQQMVAKIMNYYRATGRNTVDGLIDYLQYQLRQPYYMRPSGVSSYGISGLGIGLEKQLSLLYKFKAATESTIGSSSSFMVKDKDEASDSTTNLKVNIKMKQSDLPEGIKLLLQAAANSLQVVNEKRES